MLRHLVKGFHKQENHKIFKRPKSYNVTCISNLQSKNKLTGIEIMIKIQQTS